MTIKLENLFDLPKESVSTDPDVNAFIEENKNLMVDIDQAIDKIDLALPTVRDLDTGDDELDELAKLATDKFNDLIDLGMNVEARFSGTILQTAGVLLGHAITAKTAKMDKKLRMINLQLQKAKLDYQIKKDSNTKDDTTQSFDGHAVVLDRNELLRQILAGSKDIKSIQ
jgi:hypothetical protein